MTAEYEGGKKLRRHFPDRRIALEHVDFTVDDIRCDQSVDRLTPHTGRERRPFNELFDGFGDVLAFLCGLEDRVADFSKRLSEISAHCACAIGCGVTLFLYIVFLTMIPFVFSDLGYSVDQIGLMYLSIALTFIPGTVLAKRLHARLGDIGTMNVGVTLVIFGAIALNAVTLLLNVTAAWQIIAPFSFVTFGNGFLAPNGQAYLMRSFKDRSGGCASSMGFLTMAIAFVSSAIAALLFDHIQILALSYTIAGFAAALLVSYLFGISAS